MATSPYLFFEGIIIYEYCGFLENVVPLHPIRIWADWFGYKKIRLWLSIEIILLGRNIIGGWDL